jgi:CTP:molybdopterin cytidylyltransferase MocA/SAM-dependent methyltransferase
VTSTTTAIVLAAGAGRRFGGGKLLASLEGRPILQHVLDALAAAGVEDPVVVVGPDNAVLDAAISWRSARRVVNDAPARGLSSSLQVGWAAATATNAPPASVLVLLGDQPRVDPSVIRTLIEQPLDSSRPIVVARHADGARNPVRIELSATALVASTTGDRGLGPLLDANPDLVRVLDGGAANPDIDERRDLVALLEAAWAARVRADAEQVERIREAPDGRDFYAAVSRTFVADPARADDPVLQSLLALTRPEDTWLDVGAGAGRYALPIARHVREVVAVDPSASMLDALRTGMKAHGIPNIDIHEGRWPADAPLRKALGPDPIADVAMIAHVSYDIAEIGPFLDALERAARRVVVAVLMSSSPASVAAPFWRIVHGEPRVTLPALPEFVELLRARGSDPVVKMVTGERRRWADRDELVAFLRRHLWIVPGGAADGRLLAAVDALVVTAADGSVGMRRTRSLDIGIVSWGPPSALR